MSFMLFFAGTMLGLVLGMGFWIFLAWIDQGYAKELTNALEDAVHQICELERENKALKSVGPDSIHSDDPWTIDPDWWKDK